MKINDKYEIVAIDDRNVAIQEKIEPKKKNEKGELINKEPSWRVVGYYRDVNQALHGLIRKEINGTGLKDFETVCKKIDELKEYVDKVCK